MLAPVVPGTEAVVALVERGGRVCSQHVPAVNGKTLKPIIRDHIAKDANIMTDEHGAYHGLASEFASHQAVKHGIGEYVRGDIHTNTIEGYFSIMKRAFMGCIIVCRNNISSATLLSSIFATTNVPPLELRMPSA